MPDYTSGYTASLNDATRRQSEQVLQERRRQEIEQIATIFQQAQADRQRKMAAQSRLGDEAAAGTLQMPPGAGPGPAPQPPMPGAPSVPMMPPGGAPPPPMGQMAPPPGPGFATPPAAAGGPPMPAPGPGGPAGPSSAAPGPAAAPAGPAPGWKPLPTPPAGADAPPGAPGQLGMPPAPAENAVMPKTMLSVSELAKTMGAKGIKGQALFDMLEEWKPFMDSENKQQLAMMTATHKAEIAGNHAYIETLRAQIAAGELERKRTQGDKRIDQNQQKIDQAAPVNAARAAKLSGKGAVGETGNQGLSKKYEADEAYRKQVDFWAKYMKDGNTLPPRFAQSGAGKAMFSDIVSVVPTLGSGDPREMQAGAVELQGQKAGARALGTRGANIEQAASEAREMSQIVLQTSDAFPRTDFQPINKALAAFQKNTGDPKVRQFGAAINSYINAYARAVSPVGVATVSDKDHAREMLSTADSQEQVSAIIKVLDQEMTAAQRSPRNVREAMRKEITGKGSAPKADYVEIRKSKDGTRTFGQKADGSIEEIK